MDGCDRGMAGEGVDWTAPRFFVDRVEGLPGQGRASLEGEEAHHAARVLRLRPGDPVVLLDGTGYEHAGRVTAVDGKALRCEVACLEVRLCPAEPELAITLLQGLPKGDKMDFVVEKGTEAGISRFVPVRTARSIPRLEKGKEARRLDRWRRIAAEAAKQCRRGRRPEVGSFADVGDAVEALRARGIPVLLLWERAQQSLKPLLRTWRDRPAELGLVVGPEGGFSAGEAEALTALGATAVTLGERILRTESAGTIAAAILLYELEG